LIFVLGAAAALFAAGCDRDADGIRTYSSPKDPPPAPAKVAQGGGKIHWTVRPEWKALPPGEFSMNDYEISANPPLKLSVSQVKLMGSPIVTLLENVNRWRRQLGLPPVSQEELGNAVTSGDADGRPMFSVDLTTPAGAPEAKRTLAALVFEPGTAYAFKVMGPADLVGAHKADFDKVLASIHYDAPGSDHAATGDKPSGDKPSGDKPAASAGDGVPPIDGISNMTLPEGWRLLPPEGRGFGGRAIMFGDVKAQGRVVVSRLGPMSLNDVMGNVNRWRGQVNLPPATDPSAHPPQDFIFAQGPGLIREFSGPEGGDGVRLRQYVAYTQFAKADAIWFFRLIGPYDLVTKTKPQFDAFVKSLKFDDVR
jgi:hypothetical protein